MRNLFGMLLPLFLLVGCGKADPSYDLEVSSLAVYDPGLNGPYTVKSYLPSGSNAGYQSVIIYYPSNSADKLLPATTLSGGFTNTKENMSWLGQQLASHGFVVAVFTPTNPYALDANVWARGHKAAVQTLINEGGKSTTPIAGRVDKGRIGAMGYSYGGAGTIIASNELGDQLQSAVTLCAYNPVRPTNPIPSLFITGTADTVASPSRVLTAFNNLKTDAPKAFARFNRLSHLDITNGGGRHETLARFSIGWSLAFLAGNAAYETYVNGDELQKQTSNSSVFASPNDYIYSE